MRKIIISFLLILLGSCSQSKELQSDISIPTQIATQTASPTEIPSPTATLDINTLSVDEVVRLLINGEIEYPTEFDDAKRAELAIAIAEYLNENVVADEVYVPLYFEEVGDIRAGWDPESKRWRSDHNAADFIDFSGDSLPPLIVSGYTNSDGREVYVNAESGDETIVPEIEMPGIGLTSITELYTKGQNELRDYLIALMFEAVSNVENIANYIYDRKSDRLYIPVVIYESAQITDPIYHTLMRGGNELISIYEAQVRFVERPTNLVLVPIIDQTSGQILFWLNVHQGMQYTWTNTFRFSSEEEFIWRHPLPFTRVPDREDELFGADLSHSFGILVPGKTTEETYDIHGEESLLESGKGIGSEAEIGIIIAHSGNLENTIKLLSEMELRLLVLYPDIEIHQSAE